MREIKFRIREKECLGLIDKHGVEIYKGDILYCQGNNYVVEFADEFGSDQTEVEKIGNIYEQEQTE